MAIFGKQKYLKIHNVFHSPEIACEHKINRPAPDCLATAEMNDVDNKQAMSAVFDLNVFFHI